jgi:hypothetical protein
VAPASLVAAIDAADPRGRRRKRLLQPAAERRAYGGLVFVVLLSGALAGALAALGGVSYAATAVSHATRAVRTVVVVHTVTTPRTLSAGGDQYQPGFSFGDPEHNHPGPPDLVTAPPGQKAPPPQTTSTSDGKAVYVNATLDCDEQAALYFSVLDASGVQLLLTQKGSQIGDKVNGPQTKTIHFVMLVPRLVTLRLRIPANLVQQGQQYRIRVIAVDPQGNKTRFYIPFSV